MGQLCSKGLDDSGPKYAAGEASPQYGGKGVVSHGDGRDGGAGAGSRTAHKASSGSGAGDSSKSATLQQLRRENQELREALAEAQRVISSTEKTQLQLDNKHQELQRSYENLASANHQLRRRFSNLTTGHLDESSGEFAGGAVSVLAPPVSLHFPEARLFPCCCCPSPPPFLSAPLSALRRSRSLVTASCDDASAASPPPTLSPAPPLLFPPATPTGKPTPPLRPACLSHCCRAGSCRVRRQHAGADEAARG